MGATSIIESTPKSGRLDRRDGCRSRADDENPRDSWIWGATEGSCTRFSHRRLASTDPLRDAIRGHGERSESPSKRRPIERTTDRQTRGDAAHGFRGRESGERRGGPRVHGNGWRGGEPPP